MPLSRRRVVDAVGLRTLGHPVRLELLELLLARGPHTATEAGKLLGQTPANCSWHLRRLADHGFVREVPGRTGRHRPWQAVTEGLSWGGDLDAPPDGGAAAEAVDDVLLARDLQRHRAARAATEPPAWQGLTSVVRATAHLDATRARELAQRLEALVAEYADAGTDSAGSDARPVGVVAWLAPLGPPVPGPAAQG